MGGMLSGLGAGYGTAASLISDSNNLQWQRNVGESLSDYQARAARLKGLQDEGRIRLQGSQTVAAQRTAYANSGIDEKSGTAANVQADTAALGELDAQTVRNNAAREAWGFKLQKGFQEQEYNAKMQDLQNRSIGQLFAAGGQFAGGAGSLIGG